jgi:hypothetical protein
MSRLRNISCSLWSKTTENEVGLKEKLHVLIFLELKTKISYFNFNLALSTNEGDTCSPWKHGHDV